MSYDTVPPDSTHDAVAHAMGLQELRAQGGAWWHDDGGKRCWLLWGGWAVRRPGSAGWSGR